MTPSRRVIFVNRFYWPDEPATAQLLTDLAESLATAAMTVTVITSHPGGEKVPLRETHRGVEIVRVRGSRFGRASLAKRALDFATFILGARRAIAAHAHPGDALVVMTDPPLLGVALAGLAKQKKLRLVHWVQDVFPEVAMTLGHGFTSVTRGARDRAWRTADVCVTLGEDMASLLRERGVPAQRIHCFPNWAPAGLQPLSPESAAALRQQWGLTGKFVVAYSGNLGRVHDFATIIPLATALHGEPDVAFVFIGDGAQRRPLEDAARTQGLTNIHFCPPQPRERLAVTLALGDVHLITLRPGCERLVFPSKLYGIAAVGRPVLFIGPPDCEVACVIETNGFGSAFAADDVERIAASIREFRDDETKRATFGQAAAEFSSRSGRLHHAATRWLAVLAGKPLADDPTNTSV
jgi:colanic acid biosynthesis glycosyl transferase WcaI